MSKHPDDSPDTTYHSKRDTWIVIILWAVIVFCAASAIYITFLDLSIILLLSQEVLFLGAVALCLSILRSTYYILLAEELFVRTGPFKWTIPLSEIESVIPERNLWSSAALSIDRLHIRYQSSKAGAYISPAEEEAFLLDLANRCPHLQFENNRVIGLGDQDKYN